MASELLNQKSVYCKKCGIIFRYRDVVTTRLGRFNIPITICPRCGNSVHIVPSVKDVARVKNSNITTESL